MTEVLQQPDKPHAYLVAGGGGGQRSTIILRMIAHELTGRGISYTPIEGIYSNGQNQMIRHPSLQMDDLEASISQQPEKTPLLIISHCIGTIAALGVVEKFLPSRPASLVSISPPLSSPRKTISQPQSQRKRSEKDTLMRVVDLPNGAVDYSVMTESVAQIDPQYFEDINDADNLEFRLRAIVEAGSAAVYVPEHGWNTGVLPSVQGWHDDWSATLSQDSALALRSRTPIIHGAAHGLYISPYSTGREVTTEENVRFQMGNVNKVIDAGLWLLAES